MMKVITPYVEFLDKDILAHPEKLLVKIEKAGRTCYKSESDFNSESASKFIRGVIKRGHESVIEHASFTVKIVCDRGITHEIVRHRIASYSQESTRYVCATGKVYDGEMTVIKPIGMTPEQLLLWENAMKNAETTYKQLIGRGVAPQMARSVLPNSLKTEIVVTMNMREWRHFLYLRCASDAHPQMRQVAGMIGQTMLLLFPAIFEDLKEKIESCKDLK